MENSTDVLSVFQFTLKSALSVEKVSQPETQIWSAMLQYLQACQGCRDIYWATTAHNPKFLDFLIVWENTETWQRFILV